jgi:hypothetical protein
MAGCEEFEIAIERRAHGALDEDAGRTLTDHLGSCESCRAFATLAHGVEDEMRLHAQAALGRIDWSRVEAGLTSWQRGVTRFWWRAALAGSVLMPLAALAMGGSPPAMLAGGLLGFLCGVGLVLLQSYRAQRSQRREALRLERQPDQLLAMYRAEVERGIKQRRQDVWVLILLGLLALPDSGTALVPMIARFALAALVLCGALYVAFLALPRLRRERAALD